MLLTAGALLESLGHDTIPPVKEIRSSGGDMHLYFPASCIPSCQDVAISGRQDHLTTGHVDVHGIANIESTC